MAHHFNRFLVFIDSKLGRCRRCMRSARNGAMITWIAVAGLSLLWPGRLITNTAWLTAFGFSLLWFSHGVAFAWRQEARIQRFRRTRSALAPVARPGRREFFNRTLKYGSAVVLSSLSDFSTALLAQGQLPDCDCYYTEDCTKTQNPNNPKQNRGNVCEEREKSDKDVNCKRITKPEKKLPVFPPPGPEGEKERYICARPTLKGGKGRCLGTCKTKAGKEAVWDDVNPSVLAQAADLYFQSYLAMGTTGGPPDTAFLSDAVSTQISQKARTNDAWHVEIIVAVNGILGLTLGNDFMVTPGLVFGQVPVLEPEAFMLVDTARRAFLDGLLDNNPDAVVEPIRNFWARGATYYPMYGGTCYPHGHEDEPGLAECQIDTLRGRLVLLLQGGDGAKKLVSRKPTL
jgi:hypothetical protein